MELARQTLSLGQHPQLATLLQQPEALEHQLGLGADGDVAAGTAARQATAGRRAHHQQRRAAPIGAQQRDELRDLDAQYVPRATRLGRERGAGDHRRAVATQARQHGRIGQLKLATGPPGAIGMLRPGGQQHEIARHTVVGPRLHLPQRDGVPGRVRQVGADRRGDRRRTLRLRDRTARSVLGSLIRERRLRRGAALSPGADQQHRD